MLLSLLFLAAVAAGQAAARPEVAFSPHKLASYDEIDVRSVDLDALIDKNEDALRQALADLDPADLMDVKLPIASHISMNLRSGFMQNLSLLKRAGHCSLSYSSKLITADMTFGWDELAFDYRYMLQVLFVKRKGDLHGQLKHLKINVVIDVDFENYQVTLRRLDFSESGKVSISIEGHILDKIYNLVLKAVTKISHKLILNTIQSKASVMVQKKIDEINELIGKNHNVATFAFVNLVEEERVPAVVYKY